MNLSSIIVILGILATDIGAKTDGIRWPLDKSTDVKEGQAEKTVAAKVWLSGEMVDGQVQRGDKMYDAKIQRINETVAGKVKQAGETQSQQRQFSREKDEYDDSHCAKQGWKDWPCYRGWRYGCDSKQCWRTKYRSKSRWHWMAKPDTGAVIECDSNDGCLQYWHGLEEATSGDIPCYYSSWYKYPCYMGMRYGCSKKICWYEDPNFHSGYDWIIIDHDHYLPCEEHEDCFERAEEKITNLGEDFLGLIVE